MSTMDDRVQEDLEAHERVESTAQNGSEGDDDEPDEDSDPDPDDLKADVPMMADGARAVADDGKAKRVRIPAKFRNKKPSDMPRRPLSAYNLFFRDQRALIMAERNQGLSQPSAAGGLFESMAKTIAARWKDISKPELEKYTKLAKEDTLRYREQMAQYNKKFVEDKSIAAKRRRAENRKRKQQEKAQLKGLETKRDNNLGLTNIARPSDHTSLSSQLTQVGVANYPASTIRMPALESSGYNNAADLQIRLLAAHAEGLGRAIPPTPNGQMTDYLRQLNSAQGSRTFQQSTPSESNGHQEPVRDNSINFDGSSTPQDPLSILQLIQQQQNFRPPAFNTTPVDIENIFAQFQRPGQQLQMQPQLAHLDPSFGIILQLQQQQQQQQQDLARFSAEANFYQQQQLSDNRNEPDPPDWQAFPNNDRSNNT